MAGVVSSSNFSLLLEPKLRQIFFETYDEVPEQFSDIFKVKSSKKAVETDYHMAGVGLWTEKESMGSVEYETIESSLTATYTHVEYSKGVMVERKFVDDELYDQIEKIPRSVARKGRTTVETLAAAVLNNGFSTNGYDGVPLFSDSHPLAKSSSLGDNASGTSALSDSTLKTALTLGRKTKDENGHVIGCNFKKLIVPADLEFTAATILQSTGQAGTPNNDTNVIKGRLQLVVNDFLTDANNWFIQDPNLSELIFFWRVRPEFARESDFDTIIAKYRGYMRFSVGYSDWRGIVGVVVSG